MTTQRQDRTYIEKMAEGFQTYRRERAARKVAECAVPARSDPATI